ncbi:transcriptional regulator, XRE family [Methanobacterium lacus]|jgi:putative transcription factor|uniref:Transcriptional regulator, XRE family n=1 Tax=Methanobacterium lacus (strain AL-21) TaxID=877455 RepID=F0TCP5_METLA|nr:multiprotein bridging factor aMBF1 [Methanobacterium lacus]ADZ10435.1 transcriptional regulator, XRE family [Methanobacterium lacus]
MRCEICGKKLVEEPLKTKIDGSIMLTCKECSKFGKVQKEPPKPKRRGAPRGSSGTRRTSRPQEPTEEVIENFNQLVRNAREKKGWSREELGEKLYEKASVISRIESGKMVPDIKLAKKLEKTLKVVLIEKNDGTAMDELAHAKVREATIGDIARIKKN